MNRYAVLMVLAAPGIPATLLAAEAYKIDKNHSDLIFSIEHAGFSHKYGWFRDIDAVLQYDPDKPENSKVEVTVKTASLDTALPARDQDLKSDKFLDVAKHPEMRFESTKVVPGNDHELKVEGKLTLHGVTRPVTLNAKLNKAAPNPFDKTPTLGFSATGMLKRSEFGITTYIPVIGDDVAILLEVEFRRAQ